MKRIRGGRGLGDALYVRPVAEYFVRQGEKVIVSSDYNDVFIGSGAEVVPFSRDGSNLVAHYTHGKANPATNQWQDVCALAGVAGLPLFFRWEVQNKALVADLLLKANGRPIVMVNGGRPPMDRKDGYGFEMLPTKTAFDAVLAALEDCFLVEVGKGVKLYPINSDIDLNGSTSAADLLDIASISSGLVGQCSFMIPLAEALDKPLLVVWAAKGLVSRETFIRQCTPQKILSKPSSRFVMDDWPEEDIVAVARSFMEQHELHQL